MKATVARSKALLGVTTPLRRSLRLQARAKGTSHESQAEEVRLLFVFLDLIVCISKAAGAEVVKNVDSSIDAPTIRGHETSFKGDSDEKKRQSVAVSSSRTHKRKKSNHEYYEERKDRYLNKRRPKMKICTSDQCDHANEYQPAKKFPCNDSSVTGLHGRCNDCIAKDIENRCSANLVNFIRRLYTNAESKAKQRNVPFTLTVHQWLQRFHEQKGRCALTGLQMEILGSDQITPEAGGLKRPLLISPDQKVAGAGYTDQNLQFVCNRVNRMKWDADQQDFIDMCHLVSDKYRGEKD